MARRQDEASASQVYLAPELAQDLQDRLSRIEGHVRGIKKMLADERDCDDVLIQLAGVRAALNQVAILLLEGHLESCVADALRSGDGAAPLERFKGSLDRILK